ncbi:bifunctional folylpolyglutamate synthase/dihydrofolate synthase [Streptococcus hongkongensis]|nr:dihydrofolate synthase [Streptococcus uberis]
MTIQEAINWIHSFKANGRKVDLDLMHWLLQELGNPQTKFPAIHVVGTNGKGSVTAYLRSLFSQAGYKTGSFTSPFITRFNERIAIDSHDIPDKALIQAVQLLKPLIQELPLKTQWNRPTEFEVVTLLMFIYFANIAPVDLAIIEAGIGGKSDATNVFQALAVVCPSISLDHQEKLGQTIKSIAQHKAGVIKGHEYVILGRLDASASQIFEQEVTNHRSKLYALGKAFSIDSYNNHFDFHWHNQSIKGLSLQLLGQHQQDNASLAIMTALLLQKEFPKIQSDMIPQTLAQVKWPGRTEFLTDNLILDGAHNQDSILKLKELLVTNFSHRKIHILFAGLHRKPLVELLDILADFEISVTHFDFPEAEQLESYPEKYLRVADFRTWLTASQSTSDLYVVTGSLYFISQVRNYWLQTNTLKADQS